MFSIQKYTKDKLSKMTLGELQELRKENQLAKKNLQRIIVDSQISAEEIEKTTKAFRLRANLSARLNEVIEIKLKKA